MKQEVKKILKEKDCLNLFTEERFDEVKSVMKYGMSKDPWLKNYLSLDPLNKAQWIADHLVLLVNRGQI